MRVMRDPESASLRTLVFLGQDVHILCPYTLWKFFVIHRRLRPILHG